MATYTAIKKTDILRWNKEGKKDIFGDTASDVVGTLEIGQKFEVAKTGGGGRGIVMTPYLILPNGDYVLGYDAVLSSDEEEVKRKLNLELGKVQIEIAKLPIGASTERDKLIAKQNALLTELNPASKSKLPLYIGLGVGALVIGYFAYKKFKK